MPGLRNQYLQPHRDEERNLLKERLKSEQENSAQPREQELHGGRKTGMGTQWWENRGLEDYHLWAPSRAFHVHAIWPQTSRKSSETQELHL